MSVEPEDTEKTLTSAIATIDTCLRELDFSQAAIKPPADSATLPEKIARLLEQTTLVCDRYDQKGRPTLRVIHHFACSGGSIFCRCLAAMPNIYLLSEAHPYSNPHFKRNKRRYLPTDIVALAAYANVPDHRQLARSVFANSIATTNTHVSNLGGTLILRDHTHADFCLPAPTRSAPAVREALGDKFTLRSLVTIRNPIESYISLNRAGWNELVPPTFEEYCTRYMTFLECYPGAEILRYEDLVRNPAQTIIRACEFFDISYNDEFLELIDLFPMTGESGRFSSEHIAVRPGRPVSDELLDEIARSSTFPEFCSKYGYQMPTASE